jgi:hypothetical protein
MRSSVALVVVSGVFVLFAQGCGGGDTPPQLTSTQALGPAATTATPPEAKMISAQSFLADYDSGQMRVTNDLSQLEDVGLAQTQANADKLLVDSYLALHPSLKMGMQPDSPTTRRFTGRDGRMHFANVVDGAAIYTRLASALRVFPTAENQLALYKMMYERLEPSLQAQLPTLSAAEGYSASDLQRLNKRTARLRAGSGASTVTSPAPISGQAGDCSTDEGSSSLASDRSGYGSSCAIHNAGGIYANFDFPMKNYATCVKDQANRGTCVAFGLTAAIETEVALTYGTRVNLSEQDLYSHAKNWWWPTFYGDGLGTHDMWQKMIQKDYVIPFENVWDYNPSHDRSDAPDKMAWINSCVGYGEVCTDTAHQAGLYCTVLSDNYLYCGYMSPANVGGHGYRMTAEVELWNGDDLDGTITQIEAALDSIHPVMLGSNVPPSFDNASAAGYVTYTAAAEKSRGGHAYQIVGYLTNDTLSQKLPNAPLGSGGGYLIAKNSWSVCFADAGYVYLPFDWVKTNAWSATVLQGLVQQ